MTAPSFGRRNERVSVSLGSVAKVKPYIADLGPSSLLGPGRTLDLKGTKPRGLDPGVMRCCSHPMSLWLELYRHWPRHKPM